MEFLNRYQHFTDNYGQDYLPLFFLRENNKEIPTPIKKVASAVKVTSSVKENFDGLIEIIGSHTREAVPSDQLIE
jgi:hypothetical protein